jgi:hypothetical protein
MRGVPAKSGNKVAMAKKRADNIRRIDVELNLNDPVDAAIWAVLEPMVALRRGGQGARSLMAAGLGGNPPNPGPSPRKEGKGEDPRPRPLPQRRGEEEEVRQMALTEGGEVVEVDDGKDALARATNNFLDAFKQQGTTQ